MIHLLKEQSATTSFIRLNTRECKACWKCIDACPEKVIEKIDFFFHRHAVIRQPGSCVGCLKCAGVCEFGAIVPLRELVRNSWEKK